MEFLNVLRAVLLLQHMMVNGVAQNSNDQNGMTGSEQGLREMLNAVKEQNRKLVLQNKRLQQVWFGMQQMCKALSMPLCECNQTDNVVSKVNTSDAPDVNESTISNSKFPLQVLSIKSTGLKYRVAKISITYYAPLVPFVHWFLQRGEGERLETLRKIGKTTQSVPESGIYTSTVDVVGHYSYHTIYFRLHDDEQSISIRINVAASEIDQEQNVTAPISNLIEVNRTYTAPQNSDLTIQAVINLNMSVIDDFSSAEIFLSSLNTSTNPPTFFETFALNSDAFRFNLSERTKETTNCNITIGHHLIKYGGFLTILMPHRQSSKDNMIDIFSFGPTVKIFAYGTKEVIPYNTVGTLPLQNQTFIFKLSKGILSCLAIGNPRPNATILKLSDNGSYSMVATETAYLDKYSQIEELSLSAYRQSDEACYMCRASNGEKTVETYTEAVIVKEVLFEESKTGVMKNTSKTIVISCKAKGNPRPEVDFRLYEEYGPFMIKSGLFKFKKSKGKNTSRVTVTLSAVDDVDVHTVFCAATQGNRHKSIERTRKINIFPEGREINWDLYSRVQDAQVF